MKRWKFNIGHLLLGLLAISFWSDSRPLREWWTGATEVGSDVNVEKVENPFSKGALQSVTLEQVRQIIKALSDERQRINKSIEQTRSEIEAKSDNMKNLRLARVDLNALIQEVNQLNDKGLQLSLQLQQVTHLLNHFRLREDELT